MLYYKLVHRNDVDRMAESLKDQNAFDVKITNFEFNVKKSKIYMNLNKNGYVKELGPNKVIETLTDDCLIIFEDEVYTIKKITDLTIEHTSDKVHWFIDAKVSRVEKSKNDLQQTISEETQ